MAYNGYSQKSRPRADLFPGEPQSARGLEYGDVGTAHAANVPPPGAPGSLDYLTDEQIWGEGSQIGSDAYFEDIRQKELYETGGASSQVDPNRFYLGGEQGWAEDYYNQMGEAAAGMAGRPLPYVPQAYEVNYQDFNPNLDPFNQWIDASGYPRQGAGQTLLALGGDVDYLRNVAMGTAGASPAELAMRRSADEAMRSQLAMAGSARGPNIAGAQLSAAQETGALQGGLIRDLGVQRAMEQQAALQQLTQAGLGLSDAWGTIRGQDIETAGMVGNIELEKQKLLSDVATKNQISMAAQEATKLGAYMDQQQLNDEMIRYFTSQGYDAMTAQLAASIALEQARTGNVLEEKAIAAGIDVAEIGKRDDRGWLEKNIPIIGGAAQGGAAILAASDVRAKENMRGAEQETMEFLRRLGEIQQNETSRIEALSPAQYPDELRNMARRASATRFEYKQPEKYGEGEYVGPMAQELAQSPVGATAVQEMPDGNLGVDTGRLSMINTSALGVQQRELDELRRQMAQQNAMMQSAPVGYPRPAPPNMAALGYQPGARAF